MAAFGSDLPVVDLLGSFLDRVLRRTFAAESNAGDNTSAVIAESVTARRAKPIAFIGILLPALNIPDSLT